MRKFILLIMLCSGMMLSAQNKEKQVATAVFKVAGNCDQCKNRIENAADIKGVKNSTWDEKTQMLTVIYRTDKVSEQQIKQAVAKAGHDVEGVPADDAEYKNLPACCQYRDKKCEKGK